MTHFRGVLRAALCCLAAGLGHSAAAQQAELPLWELGVGVLGRAASDYPGADDYSASLTPVPFIRYRGNFLELGGDDALRVVPFRTERFELGFSFDSSARVVNRVTAIGAVLEDLDRSLEVGPELIYRFWDTPTLFGQTFPGHLEAILQTRWVYSLDDSVDWEGTLYRPALRYRQYGTLGPGSRIQLSLGPIWTTEGLQDFYYQVPGADGYDARAGYLGTELRAALRFPLSPRLQVIGGAAATYLGGSVNRDSPLMKSDWDATAFIGLRYAIFQSQTRTRRDR